MKNPIYTKVVKLVLAIAAFMMPGVAFSQNTLYPTEYYHLTPKERAAKLKKDGWKVWDKSNGSLLSEETKLNRIWQENTEKERYVFLEEKFSLGKQVDMTQEELRDNILRLLELKVLMMTCAIPDPAAFSSIFDIQISNGILSMKQSGNISEAIVSMPSEDTDKVDFCIWYDSEKRIMKSIFNLACTESSNKQYYELYSYNEMVYYIPDGMKSASKASIQIISDRYKKVNNDVIASICFACDTISMREVYDRFEKDIEEYNNDRTSFSKYALPKVQDSINTWQKRGEYEPTSDYRNRVNDSAREQKIKKLSEHFQERYLAESEKGNQLYYLNGIYDADNQVFHIRSIPSDAPEARDLTEKRGGQSVVTTTTYNPVGGEDQAEEVPTFDNIKQGQGKIKIDFQRRVLDNGYVHEKCYQQSFFTNIHAFPIYQDLFVHVPLEEAAGFKQYFNDKTALFSNEVKESYCIKDDHLALSEVAFEINGKEYKYTDTEALAYNNIIEDMEFEPIDISAEFAGGNSNKHDISKKRTAAGKSDVDVDIPTGASRKDTYALIIANEDYEHANDVDFALNDGRIFKKYCEKTLGIPSNQIHYRENVSSGNMIVAIDWITDIARVTRGKANIIVYYAGHGVPDESTKDAYILPRDGIASKPRTCYKLSDLYAALSQYPTKSTTIFLDACFSGADRNGKSLTSGARGVAIKVKNEIPLGNIVVLSAAQGDETAHPYKAKGHGLFTYFLLKKLQETKGVVSLGDLSDYIQYNVQLESLKENAKEQTPCVVPSPIYGDGWRTLSLLR